MKMNEHTALSAAVNRAPGKRTPTRPAGRPLPAGRLDLSAMQHLTGFLCTMVNVPARDAFQRCIGRPYQLREVEFTLLVLLQSNPGAAPKQLAQALNMPAPHVTVLLDRMAERGLLERRRSPADGRALEVHLSDKGRTLAQRVHEVSKTMEDSLLLPLSPGERAMLRELLVKLARGHGDAAMQRANEGR
jgi:MarR family transcriptional regulator for hemolysin